MTTDREMERIVRSWLEPGLTTLTDDVLDPVLDQLPATPQRRRWSPARRIAPMNPIAKFAIAAAAVVVVAIVGFNLVGASSTDNVGNAPPTTIPSEGPTSSLAPVAPASGDIQAGRYRWATPDAEVTFAVQDGWTADGASGIRKFATGGLEHLLPGSGHEVTHVYTDACHGEGALKPIGDAAVDLVAALDAQKATDAVIRDVTAGGVVGQRVEIRESPGVDRSTCRYANPDSPIQIWANPGETDFNAFTRGTWNVIYVFDVGGERLVFKAGFGPETTDADVATVDAVVESFQFSTP